MKKFKAIYLILILAVLWIGAGVAGYYMLISPQQLKTKTAQTTRETALSEMKTAESAAQQKTSAYTTNAQKMITGYQTFHAIQNTMPNIYNMKDAYTGKDREALTKMYKTMSEGQLIRELKHWTKPFHLSSPPIYTYSGIMGYEETLTQVKMVKIPFGTQTIIAYGYPDLIRQVRAKFGYRHFPMLFTGTADNPQTANGAVPGANPAMPMSSPTGATTGQQSRMQALGDPGAAAAGDPSMGGGMDPAAAAAPAAGAAPAMGSFTIRVDRTNPRHTSKKPALVMQYTAYGAFFTRGWDPNGPDAQTLLATAKGYLTAPPQISPQPQPDGECPKLFGIFGETPAE